MLSRVVKLAKSVAKNHQGVEVIVTTDDSKIKDHCDKIETPCIMTMPECPSGSDRCLAAARQMAQKPDYILNLQGDAPFTPPEALDAMLEAFAKDGETIEVLTPVHRLSWRDLDSLRKSKEKTPFSGTCAILDKSNRALWFSKNIIPAIRNEEEQRKDDPKHSPVHQHMGLYGYRMDILERFCALPQGTYEQLEGLEQLRFLENGITIQCLPIVLKSGIMQSGIDTIDDLARAEAMLAVMEKQSA